MTADEPKRKKESPETARRLFATSGNLCAFPECTNLMVLADGTYVGKICHIEGVRKERAREGMTDEQLRAFENLMLMCEEHHIVTNDVNIYTVPAMQKMKADHEGLFTDATMRIYESYIDHTTRAYNKRVENASYFDQILVWNYTPEELRELVDEINDLVDRLADIDIPARQFLQAVAERAYKIQATENVMEEQGHLLLRWKDFSESHDLSDKKIMEQVNTLRAHGIGDNGKIDIGGYVQDAIQLNRMPENGWQFWLHLVEFCARANEPLDALFQQLEFSRLDGSSQDE